MTQTNAPKEPAVPSFFNRHRDNIAVYSALGIGLLSLGLSIYGIAQTRDTARMERNAALTEIMPRLEFTVDTGTRAMTLHNYGNGPAIIYHVSISDGEKTTIEEPNGSSLGSEKLIVSSALAKTFDRLFRPEAVIVGLRRILDDGASIPFLTIKTPMSDFQQNAFLKVGSQLRVTVCYVNLTVDMAWGLMSDGSKASCPQPPKDLRPKFPS